MPKVNLEVMYGFDPNFEIISWHPDPSSRHHEYKVFIKYFYEPYQQARTSSYLGIDFFGNTNRYDKENGRYEEREVLFRYDKAKVVRSVHGVRLSFGEKFKLKDHFIIDVFSGLGIRLINILYTPEGRFVIGGVREDSLFPPFDRKAGLRWKFALIFGLKVAYRL